ncbi:MAG: patatin-like phospholipase family protein, partial [Acidobacteriia bacterium]|nr:patatin-like phospholipase family protein [Terriglobia bacterium]
EVGVWRVLAPHVKPDMIVGASAGAWNGWAVAGGATPDELARDWLDTSLAAIRVRRAEPLHRKARDLWTRFQPKAPFGLTVVETPRLRVRLVRDAEITWQHLAATCSIAGLFPAVRIGGRSYVDGGLRGALPLWAAEEMGATRAIALNCLVGLRWKILRAVLRGPEATEQLKVATIVPSEPFGPLKDAVVWSRQRIERWMEMGERDGKAALHAVTRCVN